MAVSIVALAFLVAVGGIFLSRFKGLGYVDSAIGSIRSLVAAETKYAQAHPQIGYTCVLAALPSDDLTAELVRTGERNGYAFRIR